MQVVRCGDFSLLAEDYARYRPRYAQTAVSALIGLLERPAEELDAVDVGAGTGIWTQMLAERPFRSIVAIEPNDAMRAHGLETCGSLEVHWTEGTGEATGLPDRACDLLTMASAFHWVDLEGGAQEFRRVLRPGGRFAALWNTRDVQRSSLLQEIERKLRDIAPDLKRESSGSCAAVEARMEAMAEMPGFGDLVYLEARHTAMYTPTEYEGVWRSVNDVQAKLGRERFETFMEAVRDLTADLDYIEAPYRTRLWAVQRVPERA